MTTSRQQFKQETKKMLEFFVINLKLINQSISFTEKTVAKYKRVVKIGVKSLANKIPTLESKLVPKLVDQYNEMLQAFEQEWRRLQSSFPTISSIETSQILQSELKDYEEEIKQELIKLNQAANRLLPLAQDQESIETLEVISETRFSTLISIWSR